MGIIKFNNVPSTTPGLEVETFPNYVAPEKEYQVTHVPGRNGDLVVDTKTYKNVPRSYKVSMAVEPPAVSVSGSTASFEATAERALAECKTAISSDVGKVGTTIINSATDPVENNEPYTFRAVPNGVGDRENDTLIGGTVVWNQLVDTFSDYAVTASPRTPESSLYYTNISGNVLGGSNTLIVGHKYFVLLKTADPSSNFVKTNLYFSSYQNIVQVNGVGLSAAIINATGTTQLFRAYSSDTSQFSFKVNMLVVDLTQMFGSTIADYIYSLEQTTAGAGVAWFRNLFPKDYYPYNAGELISVKTEAHKTTGKNLFVINSLTATGITISGNSATGSATNFFVAFQNGININIPKTSILTLSVSGYTDANQGTSGGGIRFKIKYTDNTESALTFLNTDTSELRRSITTESGKTISYIYIDYGSNGNNIWHLSNIQLEVGTTTTTYEPYEERIYPLNPALELRGIPKLNSSNKLYYDGDIYSSNGSVIRKYGIVNLGSLDFARPQANMFSTHLPLRKLGVISGLFTKIYDKQFYSWSSYLERATTGGYFFDANTSDNLLYLKNENYNDATAFKAAMSGVYLIYELATPVIESTTGLIDNVPIASFDDGADNEPVNSLVVDITAMESGSGAKSPDNPYTISGFDNGIITRCGKNLFNANKIVSDSNHPSYVYIENGYLRFTTGNVEINNFKWENLNFSCPLTLSGKIKNFNDTAVSNIAIRVFFQDGTSVSYNLANAIEIDGEVAFEKNIGTSGQVVKRIVGTWTNTQKIGFELSSTQLEFGNAVTEFEQYNGNTYTFTFGQTVYGGHFDNKGNLVVTHKEKTIEDLSFSYESGNTRFVTSISDLKPVGVRRTPFLTSVFYSVDDGRPIADVPDNSIYSSNTTTVYIKCLSYTDPIAFKTAFAGVKIVYPIEPITLSITSQDIPTLLGNNNIFANTGNIKTLSYPKQVCPFEPAQEVDDHGTEEYIDNREVAIPVGHESKYFTAGKIYNFSWLDEAGLIKEGELNADTGVLTITNGYGIVDLGSLTYNHMTSSGREIFTTNISDIVPAINQYSLIPATSDVYNAVRNVDTWTNGNMSYYSISGNKVAFINNAYSDAATFKSAMHGVKLLYELADPIRTIQLTPVQVESLIGHNVLISESGNISVTPRTYSTYTEKMNAISNWLHSASGYARLEDTYEPDYYRRAYYDEQTDMENIFNEAGQATLNFICKPQRYLKSGEEPITISSSGLIQNRTRYEAYPILKVTTNNTQGSVAIGNHSITIKAGAGTDPIIIDCELQDAWSGTSNKNSYIVLTDGEFPVIDPGTQTVTFDGGVQSVEVIPRWWTV